MRQKKSYANNDMLLGESECYWKENDFLEDEEAGKLQEKSYVYQDRSLGGSKCHWEEVEILADV